MTRTRDVGKIDPKQRDAHERQEYSDRTPHATAVRTKRTTAHEALSAQQLQQCGVIVSLATGPSTLPATGDHIDIDSPLDHKTSRHSDRKHQRASRHTR
jgi:hypothetical protein